MCHGCITAGTVSSGRYPWQRRPTVLHEREDIDVMCHGCTNIADGHEDEDVQRG